MTRAEIIEMAENLNRNHKLDPPIDTSLSDDELQDAISMVIMSNMSPGALDPKPGEPMDSIGIAIEEAGKRVKGEGPSIYPTGEDFEKN